MSLQPLRNSRPSRAGRYGSFIVFIVAMVLLGFLAQFQWAGYVLILGYVVAVFVRDIPVRVTFILALLSLAMVPVGIVLSNYTVAQNFAAYCFTLLLIGVVVITISLRRDPLSDE